MKKLKSLRHNTVTDWKFCKTYYVINSLKNNDYIFVHFFYLLSYTIRKFKGRYI